MSGEDETIIEEETIIDDETIIEDATIIEDGEGEEETEEDGEGEEELEEELEEITIDGKVFKVSDEVKKSVMMHADYTEKTMALTADKETVAAANQRLQKEAAFFEAHSNAVAQVTALDLQIKEYEGIDWMAWSEQDPVQSQQQFMRLSQIKGMRDQAVNALNDERRKYDSTRELELANLSAERDKVLLRDIKGWNPAKSAELNNFAKTTFGFTDADLEICKTDPRIVKLLHAAEIGHKLQSTKKTVPKVPSKTAKTVTKLKSGGGKQTNVQTDDMSMDEWVRLEELRMANKQG